MAWFLNLPGSRKPRPLPWMNVETFAGCPNMGVSQCHGLCRGAHIVRVVVMAIKQIDDANVLDAGMRQQLFHGCSAAESAPYRERGNHPVGPPARRG